MKTTVDLPDDLFIAAKRRAAELRQPLRALIERGLRAELERSASRLARECSKLDRGFEKALAEEGMSEDLSAWPAY